MVIVTTLLICKYSITVASRKFSHAYCIIYPVDIELRTVKPVFFVCHLFCKFHDLDHVVKIMGHEYLKCHAILVYYLVQ